MSNSSFFTGSGITANQTSAIATSVTAAASSATSSASSATTSDAKAAIATTKANEAAASAAASEASKDASVVAKNAAASSLASASTQATNSANSASSAGSQANSSASSASTASGHASTATTKANEAAASAALANTKAGIATTAANSTSGSATAAASSASAANQSKINALAAELEAENAEAVALNASSIATSKAQVASEAAITATNKANQVTTNTNTSTTKANEAAASATAAASSATTSTASKNAAVAVTANFLGAHSSAPTQTAAGGSLAVGMLYFDTGSDVLKVRASGGWINAGSSINGTSARFAYTLTANQTTVTGNDAAGNALAYDSGFADVYLNGVKLAAGDFTATSGTSIVLAAGATANDILEVVAFGTFQLTNGTFAGTTTVNNLTVTGTVDGQDVAAMGSKLAGIEASATADQTKSDIEGLGIDVPAANITGTIAAARLSTAATQAESDDSTKIATTAYVVDKITTLIGGAPSTLNDLNELAQAINDDANYNSTLTTALGTKMPKAGGSMTGALSVNSANENVVATFTSADTEAQINLVDTTGSAQIRSRNDLRFYTNGGSTRAMDVTSSGNVGIGIAAPAQKLHINNSSGTTLVRAEVAAGSAVGFNIKKTGGTTQEWSIVDGATVNGRLQILDVTDNRVDMTFDGTGKVGIGDTAPQDNLEVRSTSLGGITISSATHNYAALSFARSAAATARIFTTEPGALHTGSLHFQTSNASGGPNLITAMTINNSQNVGIGVLPTHKLHALSADNKGFLLDRNSASNPVNLNEYSTHYSLSIKSRAGGSYLNFGGTSAYSSLQATDGAGSAAAKIISLNPLGGNCGIGTSVPTALLELASGAPTLTLNATGQATNKKKVRLGASQVTAGDFHIQQMNDNGTTVALNAFTIKNGGNVGIQNTNPAHGIQTGNFRGTGSAPSFSGTSGDGFAFDYYNDGNPYPRHGSIAVIGSGTATADLSFWTDSGSAVQERVKIDAGGKVGFGTSLGSSSGISGAVHIMDRSFSSWNPTITKVSAALRVETHFQGNNDHARAAGDYGGGIAFNHLGGHSAAHGDNLHAWIGLRVKDTPSHERSSLVFATNDATSSGAHDTGCTQRILITPSGDVVIGTGTEPSGAEQLYLSVNSAANFGIGIKGTSSSNNAVYARLYNASGGTAGQIVQTGSTTTSFQTSSDYRLKENVNYDWDATTRLKQLKPARFNWIADGTDIVVDGFLAHEAQAVVPEAVTGTKDAMRDEEYEVTAAVEEVTDDDGNVTTEAADAVMGTRSVPDMQGIDQSKIVPLLVKTILELEARITALEA